jgi:hypothetical protein
MKKVAKGRKSTSTRVDQGIALTATVSLLSVVAVATSSAAGAATFSKKMRSVQ